MIETPTPALDSVRTQLETICRATALASAPRLRKLLHFLVEESLAGNPLKESIVGVAVFGRDPGYDPKQDSVVRTEVRRLRAKLIEYYAGEGSSDAIIIDLPKGSYAPAFRIQELHERQEPPPAPPSRRPRWRLPVYVAGLLLFAAAIVAGFRLTKPTTSRPPRRAVAVLDFRNLTSRPETEWMASAIPEMMRADLASGQQVRTIPGENVARMQSELALRPVSSPSRETLAAIRRNLSADVVISGDYADLGPAGGSEVRIDVWAEDARTGDIIASIAESGPQANLLDLLARAGARLRSSLHLEASPASELALRAASPADPAAARAYAEGLAHLRRSDLPQARDLLHRAVDLEPDFAPAHAAFSAVYAALGYDRLAREQAQQAFDLSASVRDPDQKLAIDAQFREVHKQWEQAVAAYARLFAQHPDDIEYGLRLAAAQVQQHRASDALRTINLLRALPAPESDDPRIDLQAARVRFVMSEYASSAELSAKASRKAAAIYARLLYARALSNEGVALLNAGDPRWQAVSEEARAICAQFGDQVCVSDILRRMGNARVVGALDFAGAERDFDQALHIARQIGSASDEATALNGLALASGSRGELTRASELLSQVVGLSRKIPDSGIEQLGLDNRGDVLFDAGRLQAARESLEAALDIARANHHRDGIADEQWALAEIAEMQGDLPRARQACAEVLSLSGQIGLEHHLQGLEENARLLWLADDLPAARRNLEQAARLRKSWPDKNGNERMLSALVALAEGKPSEAATTAREGIRLAIGYHQVQAQARGEAVLAQALVAGGDLPAARTVAHSAMARMEHSQFRLIRLEVAIANARVRGDAAALSSLIADARSLHAYELEIFARLAQAELTHNRRQLDSIRHEAHDRGFEYVARRALE